MQGRELTLNLNKSLVNFNFGSYTTTLLMNLKSKLPKIFELAFVRL